MIAVQNIIDKDKSLFTIIFDRDVLKHLQCKPDDYVAVLQSNFKHSYFMVIKSDSGYRIRRYPQKKKTYQVNVSYKFKFVSEFDFQECTYFKKKNGMVRVSLNI